jgi:hypothetical protein
VAGVPGQPAWKFLLLKGNALPAYTLQRSFGTSTPARARYGVLSDVQEMTDRELRLQNLEPSQSPNVTAKS